MCLHLLKQGQVFLELIWRYLSVGVRFDEIGLIKQEKKIALWKLSCWNRSCFMCYPFLLSFCIIVYMHMISSQVSPCRRAKPELWINKHSGLNKESWTSSLASLGAALMKIFHSEVHMITLTCLFVYTMHIHSGISPDLGSALGWKASWQCVNYFTRSNVGLVCGNEPMTGQGLGECLLLGKEGLSTTQWQNLDTIIRRVMTLF